MFPCMNPSSICFVPANAKANITAQAIFKPVQNTTITGVSVSPSANVTGANADYVLLKLIQLANASNVVATVNIIAGVNLTANTAYDLTLNSTLAPVAAGTALGLVATFNTVGNVNLGSEVLYQIDYIQGSPASEG